MLLGLHHCTLQLLIDEVVTVSLLDLLLQMCSGFFLVKLSGTRMRLLILLEKSIWASFGLELAFLLSVGSKGLLFSTLDRIGK